MHLILVSDFLQVLYSASKFPTKDWYFSKDILFPTIYLLQEKKLNTSNNPKQELIMGVFVWATDHDVNMHAKI
jgi:hypothetical protein